MSTDLLGPSVSAQVRILDLSHDPSPATSIGGMRAVVITAEGDTSVIQVQDRPDPTPGPGQVRVEVKAAGVNFADVMARMGLYPDAPPLPAVVGYEVAGEVVEVGPGVDAVAVGDRVLAGCMFGGYAEQVVVGQHDLAPLPERLTFAQGAAVLVNYATAWEALLGSGHLRAGDKVLVHAAAGGVGIAATQLAKQVGAEVWGTASASKHDAIRAQGLDHPLDYHRDGWDAGLPPFDVVLDALGGASLKRSYAQLRPGGRVIAFGASSVVSGEKKNLLKAAPQALRMVRGFDLMKQLADSKTVVGLNILTLWKDRGSLASWLEPLDQRIADGTITPVVAAEVPFAQAAEAHKMLSERRNVGKVVLVP